MFRRSVTVSSLATLFGLLANYATFRLGLCPLLTDTIAEWIMARTPSPQAVWLLANLGAWAKPLAATGALATLGVLARLTILPTLWRGGPSFGVFATAVASATAVRVVFGYDSVWGLAAFFAPVTAISVAVARAQTSDIDTGRRRILASAGRLALPAVMGAGVAAVAIESFLRNEALARSALEPVRLFPFTPPRDDFSEGLIRSPVTPVAEFYGMSKNTVDPSLHPDEWRLRITIDGDVHREFRYDELLSLPRKDQYVSFRCVSNTLRSNLMGTALWSGVRLGQLVDLDSLPTDVSEIAFIGADGHGDSLTPGYAFDDAVLLALGMNGKTLDRTHGFPIRLVAPRYYGFKQVKWITEIAVRTEPYIGTWPKMGYTKEPVIHTVSYIDRIRQAGDRIRLGGIAMSGHGAIRQVQVRAGESAWFDAVLERPLSPHTWTRWKADLVAGDATFVQARARDARGRWQADEESPLFPDGVKGPTIRSLG